MWPPLQTLDEARLGGRGAGVRVAILDTGIDQGHAGFSSARFVDPVAVQAGSAGFTVTGCEAVDVFGHGTSVAGIIHSLAPDAELFSIRVLDCRKRQHRHEAIRLGAMHALEAGAHILNCSFGLPGAAFSLPVYKSWTDHAFELDRHVVAAASNGDPDAPHWPASFPQVIATTSAALPADQTRFRPRSLVGFEARGIDVPVLAPGNGSAVMTGSSFAAAHLSGILARILGRFPDLSPSFALDALRQLGSEPRG